MKKSGFVTPQITRRVKQRDGHCLDCGAVRKLTVHHIVPISQGGSKMDERNMETLCRPCHNKKHGAERDSAERPPKKAVAVPECEPEKWLREGKA